jgi:hypothetical protein
VQPHEPGMSESASSRSTSVLLIMRLFATYQ